MRRGSGRSRLRRRSRSAACGLRVVRAARRGERRRRAPAMLHSARAGRRRGAPFRRLSGVSSGCATGGAAAIGTRSPVAAAIPPTCYRSTTCCRLPRGADRSRRTWLSRAWHTTACATATDPLRRRSRGRSATSTPRKQGNGDRTRHPTTHRSEITGGVEVSTVAALPVLTVHEEKTQLLRHCYAAAAFGSWPPAVAPESCLPSIPAMRICRFRPETPRRSPGCGARPGHPFCRRRRGVGKPRAESSPAMRSASAAFRLRITTRVTPGPDASSAR